jgi:hypothetical protein
MQFLVQNVAEMLTISHLYKLIRIFSAFQLKTTFPTAIHIILQVKDVLNAMQLLKIWNLQAVIFPLTAL